MPIKSCKHKTASSVPPILSSSSASPIMPPAHLTRERVTQFKLSLLRPSAVTGKRGDFLYSSDCRSSRKGAQSSPRARARKEGAHAAGRVVVGGRQMRVRTCAALFEDHPHRKGDATKSVHDHSYGHLRPSPSSIESPCRIQSSLPLR